MKNESFTLRFNDADNYFINESSQPADLESPVGMKRMDFSFSVHGHVINLSGLSDQINLADLPSSTMVAIQLDYNPTAAVPGSMLNYRAVTISVTDESEGLDEGSPEVFTLYLSEAEFEKLKSAESAISNARDRISGI